ncbi:hypothetical protein ASE23_27615 [Rhizobium sp. Root73]|nr:hypothetical protein ASD36_26805 [Rhizobium sp. Root1334]KRC06038.1 hypothetical protein ASE23_27615 [Rhizobium sp. Root73]
MSGGDIQFPIGKETSRIQDVDFSFRKILQASVSTDSGKIKSLLPQTMSVSGLRSRKNVWKPG